MTIRKKQKQTPKIKNWARKSSWKIGFLLSHIPFVLGFAESSRRSLFWVLHKCFPVLHLLWPYWQGWSWTSEVLLLLRKDSFQRRVEERTKEEVMREWDICLRLKHLWECCHFLTILGTHKSYRYMDQIQGVDNGGASSLLSSTVNRCPYILGCCNVNPQYEYTVAQGFCKDKMMHNIYQWFNRKIDTEEAYLYWEAQGRSQVYLHHYLAL